MEIIHLILGKANPERMNGVNRVVHEMATIQTKLGYQVEVWGITANLQHDYPARSFKTRLFQSYKNPFRLDAQLRRALLQKRNQVVVHIHGAFLPRFFSASRFLERHQIPFIITPHSSYNKVMMMKNEMVKKVYFSFFEKKLLDAASAVHLLGQTEWDGLEGIYHNHKSVMIPYGFTRNRQDDANVEKQHIFTAVYCGRIAIYHKGLDIMLEGFARFAKNNPSSQLIIIGDGKEREQLLLLTEKLGITDKVIFKGSVFGNEKIKLLQQCHVFVHPSRTDGIPATIVEAAALGLPCVVSEATNTAAYIAEHDAGYAMPSLDAVAFGDGLQLMYNRIMLNGEAEELKANAFCMIDSVFNWKRILEQLDIIYQKAYNQPVAISQGNMFQPA